MIYGHRPRLTRRVLAWMALAVFRVLSVPRGALLSILAPFDRRDAEIAFGYLAVTVAVILAMAALGFGAGLAVAMYHLASSLSR